MRVRGTVQGVGFRPFVYRLAVELGLAGSVLNDSDGVLIDAIGSPDALAVLAERIVADAPPMARVTALSVEELPANGFGPTDFRIVESVGGGTPDAPVSIDTATCDACLREVDDPADRRYRYPFTNCTNCGPRYTIVRSVPYDRPATTMAGFAMCERCLAEYHDPSDRRFHAQPNACPECGPQLRWTDRAGGPGTAGGGWLTAEPIVGDLALRAAVDAIVDGRIVALKGIGGYHLVVDATNGAAVAELRRRKSRDDKPFAVMAATVAAARQLCELDALAVDTLCSIRRPIVVAPRRATATVADGVAPGLVELGVMLPYSPLHHLLLGGVGRAVVMTSGNLSDEPIAHDDGDAAARLGVLVDAILAHDRAIHIRCDDSVVRAAPDPRGRHRHRPSGTADPAGRATLQVLRRSRGYAPESLPLSFESTAEVLAVGAELKSTISVTKRERVVTSHHIGDLEHLATYRSFLQAVEHLPRLYGVRPTVVAHDMHPEYLSTKFATELDLPGVAVQHHHAHIAACMVEHGRTDTVLGVAFDGLGYGPDGSLWGGELLVADLASSRRVGHLLGVPMPGGAAAIREPWRMAAVWVEAACGEGGGEQWARDAGIGDERARAVLDLARRAISPTTTSAGRLFDAAAVVLGGRVRVSYEAQAAIELEATATTAWRNGPPVHARPGTGLGTLLGVGAQIRSTGGLSVLDPAALVAALVAGVRRGGDRGELAAAFHSSFAADTAAWALRAAAEHGLDTVALSGGVFQNALFSGLVAEALRAGGVRVLVHSQIPPNDGGVSVGQAAVAAWSQRC